VTKKYQQVSTIINEIASTTVLS